MEKVVAFLHGMALRVDQARAFGQRAGFELPVAAEDGHLMLLEARHEDRVSRGWVLLDGDPEEVLRTEGTHLLSRLAPESDEVAWSCADLRGLLGNGGRAERNEPCPCASGRKAKRCAHAGRPLGVQTTFYVRPGAQAWREFLADQPAFVDAPAPTDMSYRLATRLETISGILLCTLTADVSLDTEPVVAARGVHERIGQMLAELYPMLAHARIEARVVTDGV